MYDMYFEWSDGELSNDHAENLTGVIQVLLQEQAALETPGDEEYEGIELVELTVRKVS